MTRRGRRDLAQRAGFGTLLAAALILAASSGRAAAAEPVAGCSRPIVMAAAPLGRSVMITPEGGVSGAQYDLLVRAGALGGCVFDPTILPWARAVAMLEAGSIDLLPGAVWSAKRDEIADFVVVDRVSPMLMSLSDRHLGIASLAALNGSKLRLGVVRGFDYGADYRALLAGLEEQHRLAIVSDADTAARELSGGRIDAVLMVPMIFADSAEKLGLGERLELVHLDGLETVRAGVYLSHARLEPADRGRIAAAIRLARQQPGGYLGLLKHYYPDWALSGVEEGD